MVVKCSQCGYPQRRRSGLTCLTCQYTFTFDPKRSRPRGVTDGKFLWYIRVASQNGTTFFTENQLYAAACRKRKFVWVGPLLFLTVLFVPGAIMTWVGGDATTAGVLLLVLGVCALTTAIFNVRSGRTRADFQRLLRQWQQSGKPIDRLITRPSLQAPARVARNQYLRLRCGTDSGRRPRPPGRSDDQ